MERIDIERKIRELMSHAWDEEVKWNEIEGWLDNFKGFFNPEEDEKMHAVYSITEYMYFGKRLVREMLKSLYRDYFASPLKQRIRRNFGDTLDYELIKKYFAMELASTRFIGVGNPSESGAHLLYYFRQVNNLSKELFSDISSVVQARKDRNNSIIYELVDKKINRIVFFDDIVGSGTQASSYLGDYIRQLKKNDPKLDIKFMSLFSTTDGLNRLNSDKVFNGNAMCLFELDDSYKCLSGNSRYFKNPPKWFDSAIMQSVLMDYGSAIFPEQPLGYKNGQLLISFSHNTPDNVPPIYWCSMPELWSPAFLRYHKLYS
ncbi:MULTISPECIES: hypothetical protein [unclassified Pantoea]|uniref:phosphoribosyltransferase-like protein n=1 Tax=unclassified Pantoea TaxID=2630326 RepID=UPI0012319716|nr:MULTISPECIES: hypothetical protein [unclassified Pantoea]KAA6097096.1 hypothetical protein F3I21_17670 [Pantoea sp. B_9]KAA6110454.1 hypothetical protein F3I18_17880 [Pantoea sp. B_10]